MLSGAASIDPRHSVVALISYSRASWSRLQSNPSPAARVTLKAVFGPDCPRLQRRNQLLRQAHDAAKTIKPARAGGPPPEKAGQHPGRRRDDGHPHLVAVARAQGRAQVAD